MSLNFFLVCNKQTQILLTLTIKNVSNHFEREKTAGVQAIRS